MGVLVVVVGLEEEEDEVDLVVEGEGVLVV